MDLLGLDKNRPQQASKQTPFVSFSANNSDSTSPAPADKPKPQKIAFWQAKVASETKENRESLKRLLSVSNNNLNS